MEEIGKKTPINFQCKILCLPSSLQYLLRCSYLHILFLFFALYISSLCRSPEKKARHPISEYQDIFVPLYSILYRKRNSFWYLLHPPPSINVTFNRTKCFQSRIPSLEKHSARLQGHEVGLTNRFLTLI